MTELVFAREGLTDLRTRLLKQAPNEASALLLAGRHRTEGRTRILVRDQIDVPPDAYAIQEPHRIVIKPTFIARSLKCARNDGWSLILTHTHPFVSQPEFSLVDDEG